MDDLQWKTLSKTDDLGGTPFQETISVENGHQLIPHGSCRCCSRLQTKPEGSNLGGDETLISRTTTTIIVAKRPKPITHSV